MLDWMYKFGKCVSEQQFQLTVKNDKLLVL